MNGRATPVFGIPIAVQQLRDEFREDLKAHDAKDDRRFGELSGELTKVRDGQTELMKSQVAQNGKLDLINARLSDVLDERKTEKTQRSQTEAASTEFKRSVWLKVISLFGGGGALVEILHRVGVL